MELAAELYVNIFRLWRQKLSQKLFVRPQPPRCFSTIVVLFIFPLKCHLFSSEFLIFSYILHAIKYIKPLNSSYSNISSQDIG